MPGHPPESSPTASPQKTAPLEIVEFVVFALVALSFIVGLTALIGPHAYPCSPSYDPETPPLLDVLIFAGVVPAGCAFLTYLGRLFLPNRKRRLHVAGVAALVLALSETAGAVLWLFAIAMICND
jgi:hypothetical protein